MLLQNQGGGHAQGRQVLIQAGERVAHLASRNAAGVPNKVCCDSWMVLQKSRQGLGNASWGSLGSLRIIRQGTNDKARK